MNELKEKCLEMDKLLKKENVKTWEGMFKKFAEEIEKNKEIIMLQKTSSELIENLSFLIEVVK